ncbi:MAG: glycosyl hydrolase family 95 catalytic domain-containing protein [Planctomycetota bacterium]
MALAVLGGAKFHAAEQAMAASAESIISQYRNSTDKPPAWGHYKKWSTDALLMGNGDMGLSVGGEAEALRFWINKNDFWRLQHQHVGAQPKLFGWIDIKAPEMQGATYNIEQPIYNPITHGTFTKDGATLEFRARVMATANIGWIELQATGKPLEIEITTQLTDQELILPQIGVTASRRSSGTVEDIFWLQRHYDDHVDIESGMATAVRIFDDRGNKVNPWAPLPVKTPKPDHRESQVIGKIKWWKAFEPMLALGATQKIALAPGRPVTLLIGVDSVFKNRDYRQHAVALARDTTPQRLRVLHREHAAWWAEYWNRSWVSIPQKQIEKDYYGSLYVLGSAYRLRGFPPGLFGIWVLSEGPEWNGDYHLNYNHNAPTYGLFSANRIEQMDVATDPYLDFLPRARRYARELCDAGGILFPVGIGPKGIDATYNHAAVDSRYSNPRRATKKVTLHGQKSNASESLTPVDLRFRSTWDPDYAKTYYPFVADAAKFWVDYLKFEPIDKVPGIAPIPPTAGPPVGRSASGTGAANRFVLYNHSVHEGSGPNVNGTAALGLIRMTFKLALDMGELLGVDEDLREERQHILDHLSGYATWNIPDMGRRKYGNKRVFRLAEEGKNWNGNNTLGIQHIFPAGQIGLESDPDLLALSRDMISVMRCWNDFNGTNSFYPAAVRVGYDSREILRFLESWAKQKTANGMKHGRNAHGMESCTPSIVTINMMLCTGHQGVLRVFHAWPNELDAEFEDLRAFGAFLVSSRLRGGKVEYVEIKSERGRKCTIQNPWPGQRVRVTRGDGRTETAEGERFVLDTRVDEKLRLVPRG